MRNARLLLNQMSKEEAPKPSSMHMAHSSSLKDPYGLRLDLSTPLISKAMYNLGFTTKELHIMYIFMQRLQCLCQKTYQKGRN